MSVPDPASRRAVWGLLVGVLLLSAAWESLFLHHGLNLFDEGWPLYAAQRLERGGALYRDVFFCFPPGHLLGAWLGRAWAAPGVVEARVVYAAFTVALCGALYLLALRFLPAVFAALAAALLAVAAPDTHMVHAVFGYRYLLFAVLALLALGRRLDGRGPGWMALAGVWTGITLDFRLTPAFAVACGVGVALLAARGVRGALRDGLAYTAGLALATLPVLAWAAGDAGLEGFWRETVTRQISLSRLTGIDPPALHWPAVWTRDAVRAAFVALEFRLYPLLFAGAIPWVAFRAWRAADGAERARHALLLGTFVFGAVYLVRSSLRADVYHLHSALPPVCLLLAWLAWQGVAALRRVRSFPRGAEPALAGAMLAVWIVLGGSDLYLSAQRRGQGWLSSLDGRVAVATPLMARQLDRLVGEIRARVPPEATFLDLSGGAMLYVLTDRLGPGYADVVWPGGFLSPAEERAFVDRLLAAPPALVVTRARPHDGRAELSLERAAPLLHAWLREHYAELRGAGRAGLRLWAPRPEAG